MHELNFTLNPRINLALTWQRNGRQKEAVWLMRGAVNPQFLAKTRTKPTHPITATPGICFQLCSDNVLNFSLRPLAAISPMDELRKRGERREGHMRTRVQGQPAVDGKKVKPITPSGNSRFQEDAYQMLQFCRIRIVAVRNDFLR